MTLDLGQIVPLAAGLVVIVGALAAWVKWMRPFLRAARHDIVSGRDALLGRDEIRDSITGKVLAPALPGMGVRMDTNETQMSAVVDAVAQIAPALTQLAAAHRWQEAADERFAEHQRQITANAKEIADLRHGYVERIMSRADSEAAFRAIEAVARDNGHDADE